MGSKKKLGYIEFLSFTLGFRLKMNDNSKYRKVRKPLNKFVKFMENANCMIASILIILMLKIYIALVKQSLEKLTKSLKNHNSFESSEEHWIHKKAVYTHLLKRISVCAFVVKWIEIEPFIKRMAINM